MNLVQRFAAAGSLGAALSLPFAAPASAVEITINTPGGVIFLPDPTRRPVV